MEIKKVTHNINIKQFIRSFIMLTLISFILVIIGALNWLLVALFEFDVVAAIFGAPTDIASRIVYGIIGLAALILTYVAIKYRGRLDVSGDMDGDHHLVSRHHTEAGRLDDHDRY